MILNNEEFKNFLRGKIVKLIQSNNDDCLIEANIYLIKLIKFCNIENLNERKNKFNEFQDRINNG